MILPLLRRRHTRHLRQTCNDHSEPKRSPDERPEEPSSTSVNETLRNGDQQELPGRDNNANKGKCRELVKLALEFLLLPHSLHIVLVLDRAIIGAGASAVRRNLDF